MAERSRSTQRLRERLRSLAENASDADLPHLTLKALREADDRSPWGAQPDGGTVKGVVPSERPDAVRLVLDRDQVIPELDAEFVVDSTAVRAVALQPLKNAVIVWAVRV